MLFKSNSKINYCNETLLKYLLWTVVNINFKVLPGSNIRAGSINYNRNRKTTENKRKHANYENKFTLLIHVKSKLMK